MIDTDTKKGKMLASLVMGLAAAHGINDDPASPQIPGAVNLARLMMIACNKSWQREIDTKFVESGGYEDNMQVLRDHPAHRDMETLMKSFSYEQLKEIMASLNCIEGIVSTLQQTVQHSAAMQYPAQFRKDMAELGEEHEHTITVIDLTNLLDRRPPPHPPKPGIVS